MVCIVRDWEHDKESGIRCNGSTHAYESCLLVSTIFVVSKEEQNQPLHYIALIPQEISCCQVSCHNYRQSFPKTVCNIFVPNAMGQWYRRRQRVC